MHQTEASFPLRKVLVEPSLSVIAPVTRRKSGRGERDGNSGGWVFYSPPTPIISDSHMPCWNVTTNAFVHFVVVVAFREIHGVTQHDKSIQEEIRRAFGRIHGVHAARDASHAGEGGHALVSRASRQTTCAAYCDRLMSLSIDHSLRASNQLYKRDL